MPRILSRKRETEEDLGVTVLPSTLSNSGAELRYMVGLFGVRISCHRAPRSPGITTHRGCSRSALILGDPQVRASSKCSCRKVAPLSQLGSYTSITKFSRTLSSMAHRLSIREPVCQQSKHEPMTMYGFSLITSFHTLILSATLRKSHTFPHSLVLKSSTSPETCCTPDAPKTEEKVALQQLFVRHSYQHRESKTARGFHLPQSFAPWSSQGRSCRSLHLGHPEQCQSLVSLHCRLSVHMRLKMTMKNASGFRYIRSAHTRDVARWDTDALLISLDRVARSRADSCLCAGISVVISNVTHGSLNPVTTSSCVWHTISFVTFSHLHASPTIGRSPPLLRIGMADVHSSWGLWLNWYSCSWFDIWKRRQHHQWHIIEKWRRVLPRNCSNISQRQSTPSFCQRTSRTWPPTATKPHAPPGIQHHVRVVRTVLAPQDSLPKFQSFSMHLFARQPVIACTAIRSLHVFGHDVRHTLHQPSHHKVLTGNVAIELALQSQQVYPEHTLEQFHPFPTEPLLSDS